MNSDNSNFTFDEYIMPSSYHQKPDLDVASYQGYASTPLLSTAASASAVSYLPAVFDLPDTPPATTPPLLSSSSSTSTTSSTLSEKIAKVNTLPESFLPQFHQYSKETYENGRKRKSRRSNGSKTDDDSNSDEDNAAAALEMRRQVHIQSEQKRRAQISDGFQELRQHLPGCVNKKMSKAALLHRTVQHLQHLKKNQTSLLAELERLVRENEQLNKFQESVLQKQALDRMYQVPL
ncbi:hypothetical protein BC940DRAFT_330001 [Gongronella butleri]|nr:hypothetical protein BC940DRAFT_330001 [Gongronella butleri]